MHIGSVVSWEQTYIYILALVLSTKFINKFVKEIVYTDLSTELYISFICSSCSILNNGSHIEFI